MLTDHILRIYLLRLDLKYNFCKSPILRKVDQKSARIAQIERAVVTIRVVADASIIVQAIRVSPE